jgi:hypothetical protein
MKTSRSFWKLTALVLAVLILGMTPAAAQNSGPPNRDAGPAPVSLDQLAPPNPDKADRRADRFAALLERTGSPFKRGSCIKPVSRTSVA